MSLISSISRVRVLSRGSEDRCYYCPYGLTSRPGFNDIVVFDGRPVTYCYLFKLLVSDWKHSSGGETISLRFMLGEKVSQRLGSADVSHISGDSFSFNVCFICVICVLFAATLEFKYRKHNAFTWPRSTAPWSLVVVPWRERALPQVISRLTWLASVNFKRSRLYAWT